MDLTKFIQKNNLRPVLHTMYDTEVLRKDVPTCSATFFECGVGTPLIRTSAPTTPYDRIKGGWSTNCDTDMKGPASIFDVNKLSLQVRGAMGNANLRCVRPVLRNSHVALFINGALHLRCHVHLPKKISANKDFLSISLPRTVRLCRFVRIGRKISDDNVAAVIYWPDVIVLPPDDICLSIFLHGIRYAPI